MIGVIQNIQVREIVGILVDVGIQEITGIQGIVEIQGIGGIRDTPSTGIQGMEVLVGLVSPSL